ncbi:serine/threonine-protein kinase [Saccharomonospora xinjiangensis]|uniref:Serine/threonine protein kinase n=1 Tax=Saccharomonospora xinjiangensis XJ-54 TaxID=882086 RepID=I0V7E8_9PSEU|nr:serine/threonine-protein kinase [Saccharomonospora xinjiangensis]EID56051.1 serine/threonine protein kinase [Saccharomonospora xinjiangensis XJ-54]
MRPLTEDDPARVGDYTLVGRLGSGAMGTVYLGRSRGGRRVAVKLVSAGLAEEATFRDRFRHEIANMRKVGSFWTAGVVDADPDAARPWVATEYIEGPTLAEHVQSRGPLPENEVRELAAALAEALVSVHEAGVIHRDLKPGNILISNDGPRVIDFGISRVLDQTTLTATGVAIGTPGYMSPEQIEASDIGPASDIFSLAGVLVYAATGKGPFGTGSISSILYAVAHGQPHLDDVPPALRVVLDPCFSKDPTGRPTAAQLLDTLTPDHTPTTAITTATAATTTLPSAEPTSPVLKSPRTTATPPPAVAAKPAPRTSAVRPKSPGRRPASTVDGGVRNTGPLPNGFALGAALAGAAGYGVALLLNKTIDAPVPLEDLALTELVPLVITALTVLLRPFRTERTRLWGAMTLGFLLPALITVRWVPYDNLLDPFDTVTVFAGHALAPLALLAVADIAIGRRTTGELLGGTPQFAVPLASWVTYFLLQPVLDVYAMSSASLVIFWPVSAVLMFVLLGSMSGRDLLDRFGFVIGLALPALPVALFLLLGAPANEPLVYAQAVPIAAFTVPFVLVRRLATRAATRRRTGMDTREFLR